MAQQCPLRHHLGREDDEGVARSAAVLVVDEQNAIGVELDRAASVREELQLKERREG